MNTGSASKNHEVSGAETMRDFRDYFNQARSLQKAKNKIKIATVKSSRALTKISMYEFFPFNTN